MSDKTQAKVIEFENLKGKMDDTKMLQQFAFIQFRFLEGFVLGTQATIRNNKETQLPF